MKNIFYFQWHITDFCGNRCNHCYMGGFGKKHVSLKSAYDIIDDIGACCEQLGVAPFIAITGGDPLLHPNIWKILEKASSLRCKLRILGNPELVNKDTAKRLFDIGVASYQISIDGLEPTHDKIRNIGSFRRSSEAIAILVDAGLHVSVMSTISNTNYLEMMEVMRYVYSLGVKKWSFARYTPANGDCGISAKDYLSFLRRVVDEHNLFTTEGITVPMKEPLMAAVISKPIKSNAIIGGCGLGSSVLSILPDNTVMACRRHSGSVLGKWMKYGDFINFFLFHPKMEEYRDIKKIEKCGTCELLNQCRGCRAAAFVATGNTLGKDPQCFIGEFR